jgi:hypothetical protein
LLSPERVIAIAVLSSGRTALVPTIPESLRVRNCGYYSSHRNPDLVERRSAAPDGLEQHRAQRLIHPASVYRLVSPVRDVALQRKTLA